MSAWKSYFNYAGLSAPSKPVERAMDEARSSWRDVLFSESGVEEYRSMICRAKEAVAGLLSLPDDEDNGIHLLPNATTGITIVLHALMSKLGDGARIVTSDQEHPSVERVLVSAQKRQQVEVNRISASSEEEYVEKVAKCCKEADVAGAVFSHVSYKDGRVIPLEGIASALPVNAPFVVDGTQAIGQIPVDLSRFDYSAYIFCGHKWLCGPMGCGAISLNKKRLYKARSVVDVFQDMDQGTMDYASLVGFRTACYESTSSREREMDRVANIKEEVIGELLKLGRVSKSNWLGKTAPGIGTLVLPSDIPSWELANRMFARRGIAVKPFRPPEKPNAIRLSFSAATTPNDKQRLFDSFREELN